MNRNILLARKKNQIKNQEMLKKLKEQHKELKNNNIDPEKFNPDIPIKYQDDKNKREQIIKPSNFKIDNEKIKDEKEDLKNNLSKLLQERQEKVEIPQHVPKKRIIGGLVGSYNDHKDTIQEMKKDLEKKKEKGKEDNNAILSFYK